MSEQKAPPSEEEIRKVRSDAREMVSIIKRETLPGIAASLTQKRRQKLIHVISE